MESKPGSHPVPAPIRVLIVDDSVVMRSSLARMLKQSPRIELCGSASNGAEAIKMARELRPDVITLDVIMPVLDGIQALRQIMHERPCPVIMVSSLTRRNAEATLEAMALGAFDYIAKEDLYRAGSALQIRNLLLDRVEAAVQSPVSARRQEFQLGTSSGLVTERPAIGRKLPSAHSSDHCHWRFYWRPQGTAGHLEPVAG